MDILRIERIIPNVGVDKIRFGMTQLEVLDLWGAPDHRSLNFSKEYVEFRRGVTTTFSSGNTLVEIGLPRECINVKIGETYIFSPPKIKRLKELLDIDKLVYEDVGIIVFRSLGISLAGFKDDDDDDLGISVFVRGRWDEDLESMCKYKG